MTTLIIAVHIVACVAVIILVLLQSGKEGMGVIFGGGSQSVFGSTGAGGLLVKLTALFGTIFLITSLAFNVLSGSHKRQAPSIMMDSSGKAIPVPPGMATQAPNKPEDAKKGVQFEETAPAAKTPAQDGAQK